MLERQPFTHARKVFDFKELETLVWISGPTRDRCQPKTEMSPFEPFRNVPFAGSGCVLRGFSEAR
jgi:hypothetical protein